MVRWDRSPFPFQLSFSCLCFVFGLSRAVTNLLLFFASEPPERWASIQLLSSPAIWNTKSVNLSKACCSEEVTHWKFYLKNLPVMLWGWSPLGQDSGKEWDNACSPPFFSMSLLKSRINCQDFKIRWKTTYYSMSFERFQLIYKQTAEHPHFLLFL